MLDLGAQPLDVHIDQPGIGGVLVAPHLFEELLASEHLPGSARQCDQQIELEGRQADLGLPAANLMAGDVDVEVAGTHVLRVAAVGGAAQTGAHTGQQLLGLEGLGDVIVGPRLQTGDDILGIRTSGEHDDGNVRLLSNMPAYLDPVDTGKHEVQKDEVGVGIVEDVDSGGPVSTVRGLITLGREHDADHL